MNRKEIVSIIRAMCLTLLCLQGLAAQTAGEGALVLAKVDSYREYSKKGFSFDFGLTTHKGEISLMRVYLDGSNRDTSIAKYLEPKKYRRRVVLTVKNSFYVYDQGMMAPIRITSREMLFGQASAGDITRIAFTGMYSVESIKRDGAQLALRLKAIADRGATYDLIDLTVDETTGKPVRVECRGASGTLMKTIQYETFSVIDGKELLTGFTILDATTKDSCKVVLSAFSAETLPSSDYSVDSIQYVR